MGTSSNRSAGTQVTKSGITQGNTLVDPVSGQPVNVIKDTAGVRRLAVDANLTADNITVDTRDLDATTDNVGIKDKVSGYSVKVNSDGSIDANTLIQASTDNIGISDQTSGNKLKVNADGSINAIISTGASASVPTIFNILVSSANTEVSQALPLNTTKFSIKVRDGLAKVKFSFNSGQSGTNYISIGRGVTYAEDSIYLTAGTLYFQLDKAGQTVEILTWN